MGPAAAQGAVLEAELVATYPEQDVAILRTRANVPGLAFAKPRSVAKGERIYAIGYPMPDLQGQESKITDGIVSSLSGTDGEPLWFQHSAPIQGGNSGGPVVNEAGEVIGVAVAQLNPAYTFKRTGQLPQNVNYAIKGDVVQALLLEQKVPLVTGRKLKKPSLSAVDNSTVMVIAHDTEAISPSAPAPPSRPSRDGQEQIVDRFMPNWREVVRSPSFMQWLGRQDDEAKALYASPLASDAIRLLRRYNESTE